MLNDLTQKVNDHSGNLEDIDQQITRLIAVDDKLTKEIINTQNKID
jgi:hypothetical protein